MYGYITPVKEQMTCSDFMTYRAFYCGICRATGKLYGQLPRFTTNYDMVFLSVLLHERADQDVTLENKPCVCNPFKKKVSVCRNKLLDKIVAANVILSYYKAHDGVLDKQGFKNRLARRVLSGPYKKARAFCPQIDGAVKRRYDELFRSEKAGETSIDKAADSFASMLSEVATLILGDGADAQTAKLCYNVGKFVYLADALDDIDGDFKKKRYNPFLARFPDFKGRREFMTEHKDELEFILAVTVNRAIECFNQMPPGPNGNLLANVVHKGMRDKVAKLFASVKKLPRQRL
ncbi:MAG: DUF5685 family protein [Clostridiales bacterium]|nr:DUF5685 family protein [Clostridiales bacterium]